MCRAPANGRPFRSMRAAMRAVEITALRRAPRCCACERPDPVPAPGELLIRVAALGREPARRAAAHRQLPGAAGRVRPAGLEVAGVIGRGDAAAWPAGLAVGDRVCALVAGGGYAEYCVAPVGQCLPVPAGLVDVEAASLPETFFTVWSNVFDRGLAAGETCWCRAAPAASASPPSRWPRRWATRHRHRRQRRQVRRPVWPGRRPRHQLQDAGLRGRGGKRSPGPRRRRDAGHGRRRLRGARDRVPGRRRPPGHHRGAGRGQGRDQRRPGAAPPPDHHRLDPAAAPGGLQGAIAQAARQVWPLLESAASSR
jgi:hypothetical protein